MRDENATLQTKKPHNMVVPYVLLLCLLLFVCLYYGNYILWSSFVFLVALLLFDVVYFFVFVGKMTVSQYLLTHHTSCYSTVWLQVEVSSKKFTPSVARCECAGDTFYFHIEQRGCDIPVVQQNIGLQQVVLTDMYTKSIFGIFMAHRRVELPPQNDITCFVVPIVKKLTPAVGFEQDITAGDTQHVAHVVHSDEFVGNREYLPGDPIKLINFKKSTALKKAVVKEYSRPDIDIVYNIFVDEFSQQHYVAVAECILAVNEYYILLGGDILRLHCFDGFENTCDAIGAAQLPAILARYRPDKSKKAVLSDIKDALPTAVILSRYSEHYDLQQLAQLPQFSIICLVADAVKYQKPLAAMLADTQDKQIIIIDESNITEQA